MKKERSKFTLFLAYIVDGKTTWDEEHFYPKVSYSKSQSYMKQIPTS